MDYTGRLHPKEVPFSGWRYIKGQGFDKLKYREEWGKLSFRYLKGPFKISVREYIKRLPFPVHTCIEVRVWVLGRSLLVCNFFGHPPPGNEISLLPTGGGSRLQVVSIFS